MSDIDGKLEDLYELVIEHCTTEQIKDVLRRYKKDEYIPAEKRKEILIAGDSTTKRDIVENNLKPAVARKTIPEREVFALLRDAEENGGQHIFLYRAKNHNKCDLNDAAKCAVALCGKGWDDPNKTPSLRLKPDNFTWSEFRTSDEGWVAKLYGHELSSRIIQNTVEGRVRTIVAQLEDVRTVSLVRWRRSRNLLEIRVSNKGARDGQRKVLELLTSGVGRIVDMETALTKVNLRLANARILQQREENAEEYEANHWRAIDRSGYLIQGQPHMDELDGSTPMSDASDKIVESIADDSAISKETVVVRWLAQEGRCPSSDLRVVSGSSQHVNELAVRSRVAPQDLDHVLDRFLSLV